MDSNPKAKTSSSRRRGNLRKVEVFPPDRSKFVKKISAIIKRPDVVQAIMLIKKRNGLAGEFYLNSDISIGSNLAMIEIAKTSMIADLIDYWKSAE